MRWTKHNHPNKRKHKRYSDSYYEFLKDQYIHAAVMCGDDEEKKKLVFKAYQVTLNP